MVILFEMKGAAKEAMMMKNIPKIFPKIWARLGALARQPGGQHTQL